MKFFNYIILFIMFSAMINAQTNPQTINSPNGNLELIFNLNSNGAPNYHLTYKNKDVIKESALGLILKEGGDMSSHFEIDKSETKPVDNSWTPVWGEVKSVRNNYNELAVTLIQKEHSNRTLIIRLRLFDDGLGFRYEFPNQPTLSYFILSDEVTEFALAGDHKTFWIPGDYDTNEYYYTTSKMTEVDASISKEMIEVSTRHFVSPNLVQTPLMMKTDSGLYINIHEAALVDYPAMNLMINKENFKLTSHLVPDPVGNKAYLQTPCTSPWRTVIVSDKATEILASKLILNLNEPTNYEDVSWIKPMKFMGIWWEMHTGTHTWNYGDHPNIKLEGFNWSSVTPNGRHGATTERAKEYIEFASKNGIEGLLIEGWNVGWEDWFGAWKEEVFDFVTPYPDFNLEEVASYAKEKKVQLIMHHETSGSVTNYERRMEDAYELMNKYGYNALKTGYVGRIIPRGEYHDGQWMVNHYVRVAKKTAEYKIMLDAHEPVRPTGLHRTYPNWLACEAARGNEFNAWSIGNKPEHETILPFTRLMGGPMDYTPGIFEVKMSHYFPEKTFQVHTTLTKQLALYITMYSPIQMAADYPENYEKYADAFQFIKDVAVDWDDTKILEAEPGDYLTIARKAKGKEDWFIGAITDENARTAEINFNFLEKDKKFLASIYMDSDNADWENNPMSYKIEKYVVDAKSIAKIKLANGGGAAISLFPASNKDLKEYKMFK
ncbi:MAG: glycoside hydrolase family 97 protein [Melioribacteraceae bacterium]|nr:glycoside hydrolase family 97 protein [Melioribacteraceae bacterium]